MRGPRIKDQNEAFYHIISRVVDRRMVFNTNEKEQIRKTLRRVEGFSGVQVLTYALLDNHWHLLVRVPAKCDISDDEFLKRMACLYSSSIIDTFSRELKSRRAEGQDDSAEILKARYTYRMNDLSQFMKTFKQRLSQSFNARHGRKGTLWEERFKSILIQGKPGTLSKVAAYVDLNPVRAGIVKDPKDYRFSGYGEATGGSQLARAAICRILSDGSGEWKKLARDYRQLLYTSGEAKGRTNEGKPIRTGFDQATIDEVLKAKGKLELPELLRCRVRYFTDGLILGSREYVDDVFARHRSNFSPKRQTGARPMMGGFTDLFTARRLRLQVITAPAPG